MTPVTLRRFPRAGARGVKLRNMDLQAQGGNFLDRIRDSSGVVLDLGVGLHAHPVDGDTSVDHGFDHRVHFGGFGHVLGDGLLPFVIVIEKFDVGVCVTGNLEGYVDVVREIWVPQARFHGLVGCVRDSLVHHIKTVDLISVSIYYQFNMIFQHLLFFRCYQVLGPSRVILHMVPDQIMVAKHHVMRFGKGQKGITSFPSELATFCFDKFPLAGIFGCHQRKLGAQEIRVLSLVEIFVVSSCTDVHIEFVRVLS